MSIQSQIDRITANVAAALEAIASKGVTVPVDANSDDLAALILQIGGGFSFTTLDFTDVGFGPRVKS